MNYWKDRGWSGGVIDRVAELQPTVMRWGGISLDQFWRTPEQIDAFVQIAAQVGAEPLMQVKLLDSSADEAADMVRAVNVDRGYGIRYWSIGNEPNIWDWLGFEPLEPTEHAESWRAYFEAMKDVDPDIIIVGPDICCLAMDLDSDPHSHRWLTTFLEVNGDVLDVLSLHTYPFDGLESRPEVLLSETEAFTSWIRRVRDEVRSITGRDIPIAITETNLTPDWQARGDGSSASIYAGIRLADLYGRAMEEGVFMLNVWSTYNDDTISLIGSAPSELRPTYYAMLAFKDFVGELVPTSSPIDGLTAYAAASLEGVGLNIVVVNTTPESHPVVLATGDQADEADLFVPHRLSARFAFEIDGYSFASITLLQDGSVDAWVLSAADPVAPRSLELELLP